MTKLQTALNDAIQTNESTFVIPALSREILMDETLLPTIPINRAIKHRLGTMKKIFQNWIPSHDNYAIVKVTQRIGIDLGSNDETLTIEPGFYLTDGNTRRLAYRIHPDLMPATPAVTAMMYSVSTAAQLKQLYYSYDSADSVETSAAKLSGVVGGLKLNVTSRRARTGGFVSALNIAYPSDEKDLFVKVRYFRDEIELLDRLGIFDCDRAINSQTLIAACLMFAKYYSEPQDVRERMITALRDIAEARSDNLNTSGDKWTGITCLLYQAFHPSDKKWVPADQMRKTNFASITPQMNFFLWCFDAYMNGKRYDKVKGIKHSFFEGKYEDWQENMPPTVGETLT